MSSAMVALLTGDVRAADRLASFPPLEVRDVAAREGLAGLVAERLAGHPACVGVHKALSEDVTRLVVTDVVRERELVVLLAALEAAGVKALVFKGAQIAHLCYAQPHLRPRLDTDLLVDPLDRRRALEVLSSLGYEQVPQLEADLVFYQCTCIKRLDGKIIHVVDLHWRVSNPQEFGGAMNAAELASAAVPIPALGPAARGLGPVHALAMALLHPVAHHRNTDMLLWDLDVARLAARLRDDDWRGFLEFVSERRLCALSHTRLRRAVELFDAPVPPEVMDALEEQSSERQRAHFSEGGRRFHAASVLADIRALPRWRDRLRLVRQHAFPPREYMRRIYAPASRAPLALLYAARVFRGAWKWLERAE